MTIAWNPDVTLTIEAAFGSDPYATPTWTDISEYLHAISIVRGTDTSPEPIAAAGTCTLLLYNDDARFDPNNTLSPYDPDVVMTVPIRIRATHNTVTYPRFYGFVTEWDVTYPHRGVRSVVAVECVDGMQLLNQSALTGNSYPAQSTSERVAAVLDDAGWPAGMRNLDTGVGRVEALTDGAGKTALSHIVEVATAEVGSVFVAADGDLTFHNRVHHAGGDTSEGTFGPADLPYRDIVPKYNDQYLYNEIIVTGTFGTVTVSDAAAILSNTIRSLPIAGVMDDSNAAENAAAWYLAMYKDMKTRVESLEVRPQADPLNIWPVVLGVDLRDSITAKTDPPGSGDPLNQQVSVNSLTENVTLDTWDFTYGCFPLTAIETGLYWVLGTSELGTETVLA